MQIKNKTNKNYGIELLKIILALMVISLHFNASLGKVEQNVSPLTTNWYMIWLIETICYPAVNCYIIITGYFIYSRNPSISSSILKLSHLWEALLFYSVSVYLFISIINQNKISYFDLFKRIFPITTNQWWFMTLYFILIIISPLINGGVKTLCFNTLKKIMIIGAFAFMIIPQILLWNDPFGIDNGYSLAWFCYLYVTGAVIAKANCEKHSFQIKYKISFYNNIIIYVLVMAFVLFSKYVIANITNLYFGEVKYSGLLYSYNSVFIYVMAILLFLIFKEINIKNEKIKRSISFISSLSMASYLLHCQTDFKNIVWNNMKLYSFSNAKILWLVFIFTVCIIYFAGVSIEYFRLQARRVIKGITKSIHLLRKGKN